MIRGHCFNNGNLLSFFYETITLVMQVVFPHTKNATKLHGRAQNLFLVQATVWITPQICETFISVIIVCRSNRLRLSLPGNKSSDCSTTLVCELIYALRERASKWCRWKICLEDGQCMRPYLSSLQFA
jgi:hypothetical protein